MEDGWIFIDCYSVASQCREIQQALSGLEAASMQMRSLRRPGVPSCHIRKLKLRGHRLIVFTAFSCRCRLLVATCITLWVAKVGIPTAATLQFTMEAAPALSVEIHGYFFLNCKAARPQGSRKAHARPTQGPRKAHRFRCQNSSQVPWFPGHFRVSLGVFSTANRFVPRSWWPSVRRLCDRQPPQAKASLQPERSGS